MVDRSFRLLRSCRLCGSGRLDFILDFGRVPLGNNLLGSKWEAARAEKYPLGMNHCLDCGHFQLSTSVNPIKLYAENYTYLSGIGGSFVAHFKDYAAWVHEHLKLGIDALVVDVGSNDGSCLKEFKEKGLRVVGVDPARAPAEIANKSGIFTINRFFDSIVASDIISQFGKADFVTSHNVLAHVDDIQLVFKNIYRILKDDGFFCFEVGYLKEVLRHGYFDTIYHEHLDYHHATPLSQFLCSLGFDIIDISENAVQGGSLRMLLKKTGNGLISDQSLGFLDNEKKSILYDGSWLKSWPSKIYRNMEYFSNTVKKYKLDGKRIFGYGAPTKATLLLKVSGLGANQLDCVIEDNPLKIGKFLPGTQVGIAGLEELTNAKPDVIVIFAWNFEEDIFRKLKRIVNWPVTVLIPLPTVNLRYLP